MKYFILCGLLMGVALVSLAGFRGSLSRRPPIEVFPDMDRQPKLRPQAQNNFFGDQMSSQLPVAGTVARGSAWEDVPFNTGREPGTTNFVALSPVSMTEKRMRRGQDRFGIYCTPCHGALADGNGITKRILAMPVVTSLHDKRIVEMTDGEIFNTVSHGKNLMGGYAAQIPIEDRWAIIAYVRALQRARLGTPEDVPPALRATLTP